MFSLEEKAARDSRNQFMADKATNIYAVSEFTQRSADDKIGAHFLKLPLNVY